MSGGSENLSAEVAVIGGGPAGLLSAIALQAAGVDTLLIAPQPGDDHRTTALLAGSVTALTTLGVLAGVRRERRAAQVAIRIVDDTRTASFARPRLFSRPRRSASTPFGHNIENRHLIAALDARAKELKLPHVDAAAVAVASDPSGVTITFDGGATRVRLAIGADGQRSICRTAAGIGTRPPRLSADRAHAQSRARARRTKKHRDGIPYRKRTLHARPPARAALKPRLRARPGARRRACAQWRMPELSAEIERRPHSMLGKMNSRTGSRRVSLGDRDREYVRALRVLRWSARRRT